MVCPLGPTLSLPCLHRLFLDTLKYPHILTHVLKAPTQNVCFCFLRFRHLQPNNLVSSIWVSIRKLPMYAKAYTFSSRTIPLFCLGIFAVGVTVSRQDINLGMSFFFPSYLSQHLCCQYLWLSSWYPPFLPVLQSDSHLFHHLLPLFQ